MANWTKIDNNNIVQDVIVFGDGVTPLISLPNGWTWICDDESVKGNAAIGWSYNSEKKLFISPKPYDSWLLDEDTGNWNAPINKPSDTITITNSDGQEVEVSKNYQWNEETQSWDAPE